jgi:hypothetical protein
MTMKEFDGIVKGIIAAAIVGLFGWVMAINATVQVNSSEIKHNKQALMDNTSASKDLTKAITDLRVYIAKTVKE